MQDNSWELEMNEFYEDILYNRKPSACLNDAFQALKIIQQTYSVSGFDYSS